MGIAEIALFQKKQQLPIYWESDKQELATDSYKLKVRPLK